jgi:hypothetical protein
MAMRLLFALCLITAAGPVCGQDALKRPQSCQLVATSQYDDCSVTNAYRCDPAEPVAFWLEEIDSDGLLSIETRAADHGTTGLIFEGEGEVMRMTTVTEHPSRALITGQRLEEATGTLTMFGMKQSFAGSASYVYAGEMAEMAGTRFHRMDFGGSITFPDPVGSITIKGTYLFQEQLDLLIEETYEMTDAGSPVERVRLRSVTLDGQPGFGSTQPGYGCGELSLNAVLQTEAIL